jgi:hypothetical protein
VTVEEMHIAVNQGVQKIASFQADGLLPEEIDYELNTAVRRFISQRYNSGGNKYQKGFEQSQKRLDDLRHLVEDYPGYISSYMGVGYTSRTKGAIPIYRYKLPTDYMFLVNVLSEVITTCNKAPVPVVETYSYTEYLRIPLSPPKAGYAIKQITIASSIGGFQTIISATGGLTYDDLIGDNYCCAIKPSLSRNDSYTDRYFSTVSADSPTADANEFYLTKTYTEEELQAETHDQFWKFDGAVIAADDPTIENAAIYNGAYMVIDWVNPLDSTDTLEVIYNNAPTTNYLVIRKFNEKSNDRLAQQEGTYTQLRTNCKFVQQDDVYALLDDPFNCTKSTGILYTMQETFIDLYTLRDFIPNSILIKYIRRPAAINYRKGVGCELPEHTHHEVVEMAVKSILEGFESPRYQTQSGEVLESE